MKKLTKAQLARHLEVPHGGASNITGFKNLMKWTREELEASHNDLCKYGRCSLGTTIRKGA